MGHFSDIENSILYSQYEFSELDQDHMMVDVDKSRNVMDRYFDNSKSLIKNTMIVDKVFNISTVDRIVLNKNDGYIDNIVLAGKKLSDDKSMLAKTVSNHIRDLAFHKNQVGISSEFFFDFENWYDDVHNGVSDNMILDDENAVNAEYNLITGNRLFNINHPKVFKNLYQWASANGQMPEFVLTAIEHVKYLCQEILNCLLPKNIVVYCTSKGDVNIKEYTPMIDARAIADLKNRLLHVKEILRALSSRDTLFYANAFSDFWLKLTITPAISVINIVNTNTGNRLLYGFPTSGVSVYAPRSPGQLIERGSDEYSTGRRDYTDRKDIHLALQGDVYAIQNGYNSECDFMGNLFPATNPTNNLFDWEE